MSAYITTPIYYVNDIPHIGHAYTSLAADTLARWWRLKGEDVYFLTGTDEHGLKIEQAARKTGISPKAHADRYSEPFRKLWSELDVAHDDFIRTTEERHQRVVQEIWRRMLAAGDIYLDKYEGWYSIGDEAYFTEEELIDGRSPSGHEVSWVVEPSYFFRLSKYGPKLLELLKEHPEFLRPKSRYNEILRFVEQGLRDISISRTTFSWGVPVPEIEGHVVYVWVDALSNYISALGGPGAELYERFWPKVTHLIGKDILRFHAVYWPCFLMSAGLPLPERIFAHGWWSHDGEKMSKTRGNVVDPQLMKERYGADAFRYFLLREVSFGKDGDFSERALRNRINGDLANDYGNLLNRSLGMLKRYRGAQIPTPVEPAEAPCDLLLLQTFKEARESLEAAMKRLSFNKALEAIWSLVSAGNKYVDSAAPWTLMKEGKEARLDTVLYTLVECLRILGVWTLPFLPRKAARLLDDLQTPVELRSFGSTALWGAMPAGIQVQAGEPLFPRLEQEKPKKASKPARKAKKNKKRQKPQAPKQSEPIEFEQFSAVDLRVARVLSAELHPDADRLLKLSVDAGEIEPRTICAGIAQAYSPEELPGQMVVLVANLAPRKIRGVLSQGMLLAAGEGSEIKLISVADQLTPGSRVS